MPDVLAVSSPHPASISLGLCAWGAVSRYVLPAGFERFRIRASLCVAAHTGVVAAYSTNTMPQHDTLQYYPTPDWLVDKAWALFRDRDFDRILAVCAGTGAMADGFRRLSSFPMYRDAGVPVDCVEINMAHHPALRAKGYKIVGLDFEQFNGVCLYSHVITNPPFRKGASYVLKAWDALWHGEIVAILNAETLRNPCSAERVRLARLIDEYGTVQFIENAFRGADVQRPADVDVALVWLCKPARLSGRWVSRAIDGLTAEANAPDEPVLAAPKELMLPHDIVETAVRAFRAAVAAARDSARAQAVANIMSARVGVPMAEAVGGKVPGADHDVQQIVQTARVTFRKACDDLRDRAWTSVLTSTHVLSRLSAKAENELLRRFDEIRQLEFTAANVWGFLLGLVESQPQIQIDMICDVFDSISRYHTENTFFYRGWLSNDRHRTFGMRVKMTRWIIPGHQSESWHSRPQRHTERMLADFDRVFALLDGKAEPPVPLGAAFAKEFARLKNGARVTASYFAVRYYPAAGTIHFFPTRRDLVDRLNRVVGAHRHWLPPPHVSAPSFWKTYEAAESMNADVRRQIARRCGQLHDPVRCALNGYSADDRERARASIVAAIEDVLNGRGVLDALKDEEAAALGAPAPCPELTARASVGTHALPLARDGDAAGCSGAARLPSSDKVHSSL